MVIMKELVNTVDIIINKHDILYTYIFFVYFKNIEKSNSSWLRCEINILLLLLSIVDVANNCRL
jgi:hypothetical protein